MAKKNQNVKRTKIDRFSGIDSGVFNRVLRKEPLPIELETTREFIESGGRIRVLKSKAVK